MKSPSIRATHTSRLRVLVAGAIIVIAGAAPALAATWTVDAAQPDDSQCVSPTFLCKTIAAAVAASTSGDTLNIAAGTYAETVSIGKSLVINGAQAGVSGCSRTASETVVSGAGTLFTLTGGSAGTVIDGLTFDGGTTGIASASGPIDNLEINYNRFVNLTGSSIFLNDTGTDVTIRGNEVDGSSAGSGGLIHLDTDAFDGFHLLSNCVLNGSTGFFVDGNRNVGSSGSRDPLFDGNLFDNNLAGMNVGQRGIENATFSNNTFSNNAFDGLQGGPKDSLITLNTFTGNGRNGIRFGFGNTSDPTRSANGNTVTFNCFASNGLNDMTLGAAIRVGAAFAGQSATNVFNNNNFRANQRGMLNQSVDANIDAENNFWGAADGPSGDGAGTGDAVDGTVGGGSIDFDPFLADADPGAPDCLPDPVPASSALVLLLLAGLLFLGLGAATRPARQHA